MEKIIKITSDSYEIIEVEDVVNFAYNTFGILHWYKPLNFPDLYLLNNDNIYIESEINNFCKQLFDIDIYDTAYIVCRHGVLAKGLTDEQIAEMELYINEHNKRSIK